MSAQTNHSSTQPDRLQTRPTNASQHPGEVVAKRKRRTKAEMEAARAEEQALQDDKAKIHAALLQKVASLEDQLAQKDVKDKNGLV